jgi:hypothetical protein
LSDNFPPSPDSPKKLDNSLFNDCYNVLANKIRAETPVQHDDHWRPVYGPSWKQYVDAATADLDYWLSYAVDGDVSAISGEQGGPWEILVKNGIALHGSAYTDMENAVQFMPSVWHGGVGHDHAEGYITSTKDLVGAYCSDLKDPNSGLINQSASALQAAYATVVAFKQDLYNLAKRASDALDELDGGSGDAVAVGLIIAAVGIALSGVGATVEAAVAASSSAVNAAFTGGVLSGLSGLVINQATVGSDDATKDAPQIGGRDPVEIMRSLRSATDKAKDKYSDAARHAGNALSSIWDRIEGKHSAVC